VKIAVLGSGAWGSALAIHAGHGHEVTLWARDAVQARAMQSERVNTRYLPDCPFSHGLVVSATPLSAWLQEMEMVVIATPMRALRHMLVDLAPLLRAGVPVVWLCKGFETGPDGVARMGHEVCAQVAPRLDGGVLSGPSFAKEVALGQPVALVAASTHALVRDTLVQAFHRGNVRIYANADVIGVEVGGAVKNVLAIATGLCDGLHLGLNARAALITRGLAEITRLGLALGAQAETFMGLSGLGDLVLTATGDLSRNRQVGLSLAQGWTVQQAVASLGHVAEGVDCARAVVQRAQALGVDMPIAQSVVALLDGRLTPSQAVTQLMGRDAKSELG
jgi:glycerol-3-phosphate dehydrogenase (NAD(P)+)